MQHDHKIKTQNITVKPLKDAEVEITGEILWESLEPLRADALKKIQENVELPGFRKGKVPEKMIVEKFGEVYILEEAAEHALEHAYSEIIIEHKLQPIDYPKITITKLATGNPLGFKMTLVTLPEVKLPDYKAIAKEGTKKREQAVATEKEIEDTIKEIRRMKHVEAGGQEGDVKDDAPLTDEEVRLFGAFENVAAFKTQVKENLEKEKAYREEEKVRYEILKAIAKDATIPMPKILIEEEQERSLARFKDDVTRLGIAWKDYMEKLKKTEEQIKADFEEQAKEKVQFDLILGFIAKEEKLIPAKEKVDQETNHIIEHYPDAERAKIERYVFHQEQNRLVFEFLENQK